MDDLPKNINPNTSQRILQPSMTGLPGMGKEGEVVSSADLPVQEIHKELEFPKEIISSGVKIQSTVINLPNPVVQMGVKQTGVNTNFGNGSTIVLPLTQPEIAQGLQEDIFQSWRWLATWCVRRLKQLRFLNLTNPTNATNTTNE